MKHKKHLFFLILFFTGYLQQSKATLLQQVTWTDLISNSSYIFEGTVVSTAYFTGSDGNIYTNNTVHINKQIVGSLSCGDVEIVTLGGTDAYGTTQYIADALTLTSGMTGIFMCNTTSYPSQTPPAENPSALEVYSDMQGVITYDMTDGIDTVYRGFWGKLPNISLLYDQISVLTGNSYFTSCSEKRGSHHKTNEAEDADIELALSQPILFVSGGNSYVQFDVRVSGFAQSYLDHGTIDLKLNRAVFSGTMVLSNWANSSSYTGSILVGGGDLQIGFTFNTGSGISSRLDPSSNGGGGLWVRLVTVKLQVSNCSLGMGLTTNANASTFYTAANQTGVSTGPSYTDIINSGNTYNGFGCSAVNISSINETSGGTLGYYAGGIGQEIDINGTGFGSTQGKVFFQDKDAGGTNIVLESSQYKSWSDTKIQVLVPSNGIFPSNGGNGFATSGNITVQLPSSPPDQATHAITIAYSALNAKDVDGHYYNCDLRSENASNGYTFVMNTAFNTTWQNMYCFQDAIDDWECATHVNFIVSPTYTSDNSLTSPHSENTVSFGTLPNGVISMTNVKTNPCNNGSGYNNALAASASSTNPNQFDIVISSSVSSSLWLDPGHTLGMPFPNTTWYDLQTIFEHELGHCIGLNHTANGTGTNTDMMKFGMTPATSLRSLQTDDDNGGNFQTGRANATWSGGCSGVTPMTLDGSCLSGINKSNNISGTLNAYPNPFANILTLSYNIIGVGKTTIMITDIEGKIVYQANCDFDGKNINFDLGFLNSGMYLLKASNQNGTNTVKINKVQN